MKDAISNLICPICGAQQVEHEWRYRCPECGTCLFQARDISERIERYKKLNQEYIKEGKPYRRYAAHLYDHICLTDVQRTQDNLYQHLLYLGIPPKIVDKAIKDNNNDETKGLQYIVRNYVRIMDDLEYSYGAARGVGASYAQEDMDEIMEYVEKVKRALDAQDA